MNLTDLTAELEARADDVRPSAGTARIAAVRGRVRTRRRRRAAAAALIAAGCAVGLLAGPGLAGLHPQRIASPAKAVHHQPEPFTFDDDLAGDPLIAATVGPVGQNVATVRFTPTDNYLSVAPFCYLPDTDRAQLDVIVTVNGHDSFGATCSHSTVANASSGELSDGSPARARAEWAAEGVVPGRESIVTVQLTSPVAGSPTLRADPKVRVGVAVYQLSGERISSDGVIIKRDAEAGGHDYRLALHQTVRITPGHRTLTLTIPAGRSPGYLIAGTDGTVPARDQRKDTEVLIDGRSDTVDEGGGLAGFPLEDARAHTVQVRTQLSTGVLVLAYYQPVD